MRHSHGPNTLRTLASTVVAALLAIGATEFQSAAQGDARQSDLSSILDIYRDGAGGLGIPTLFLTGAPPERSVGVGDANRDGHADLAMWQADTDTVWILHRDGIGGFGRPRILSALSRQKVVAVADFNKDGIADQAVAEPFALGAWLRFGDGAGKFRSSSTAVTSRPGAVLVADFNRDARIDLARLDGTAGHLAVRLGTADGGFGAETLVRVGMVPSVMAAGDFNGDGNVDLVLGDRSAEKVAVLLGDVRGGFTLRDEYPAGLRAASLAVGDLTGDGIADVVAADRRGELVVILAGDGTGGFGAPAAVAAAGSFSADSSTGGAATRIDAGAVSTTSSADVYEGVASLTLNPATVAGGTGASSTGTVTLNAPAPEGGVVVTLTSSNLELAATVPSITVPAGATQATFTVTTNSLYRRWSGLGFSVTISATHAATVSSTLNVTAQARPAAFNSGVSAFDQTQWSGLMCSDIPPMGFEGGILFECTLPAPVQGQWGSCVFRQECSVGCRRVPPSGVFNDFCATTGPNPIAVSRNLIVGGDRVPASLVLEAPAPAGATTSGFVTANTVHGNASAFPNAAQPADPLFPFPNLAFPTGASTAVFDVATSYVPSINFVLVSGEWHPPGSAANFFIIDQGRSGHGWIAAVPTDPPPASPIPTLGTFLIVGANPVTGGQRSLAQFHLSGLTPGVRPTITLTSSHPAIVPPQTLVAPASVSLFGFDAWIDTSAPAADTDVTLTASDGRYTFSKILRVRRPDPPPVLQSVSVNPSSVVGGNSATGTVRLSAPQSGPTVVQIAIVDGAPATLPSNNPPCPPSSRCHNVTVPAGATSANFSIGTSPVTSQFNLNVNANLTGSPGQNALLLITPGGPPRLWSLSHSPDTVIGGQSATGTATLRAPAPSGGVVIQLSKDSNAASIPASVTVPAGQISATYPITTSAVTSTTTVTISTTFAGENFNDFLILYPVLQRVDFDPSTVVGGNPSIGSVILGAPAPAGGAVVPLSSNTTRVTVPASVTVPAGATSATFTANTTTVTSFTWGDVSASYAGTTVTSRLFLTNASETVSSVAVNPTSVVGPGSVSATVTLGGAVLCCVSVALASSDPALAQVPFSISFSEGQRTATFTVNVGSVSATRTATISASLNGTTRSATVTVNPSSSVKLSAVSLNPASVGGGNPSTGTVTLTAPAPAGGAAVTLSSNRAAATVPTSVTVAAGATAASFSVATGSVAAATAATISATYGGVLGTATLTVTPTGTPPTVTLSALSLNPASVVGGNVSTGTVALNGVAPSGGAAVTLTSSDASATVPGSVTVAGGATTATFAVTTTSVAATTTPTISGTYGGVTRTATLSVAPAGPAPVTLSALSLNPASVVGGNVSTGTVTLSGLAPSGGATVTLSSNHAAATVPPSVSVAAGATTASFAVNTSAVSSNTTVVITGTQGVTRNASLTVTPPPAPAAPTLSSPAQDATVAQPVTLNWNDVPNATSYEVRVDNSSTISAPFVANPTVTSSQVTLGSLPAQQLWWRVRARNAAGVFGPFSATRRFTPQAAPGTTSLSSVSVSPSSVVGPASATGTVTLTAGAPSGGAVVTLTSNNPGVAGAPGTVTVAAGATTATFGVTTTSVAANTSVTLTGSYSGVTRTATMTVTPVPPAASLSLVTLSPTSVTGGTSSTGTVTLTGAAPAGGATVALSSNNGAAAVPASVTVAQGATSATFSVTTVSVTAATASTITATYTGVTRSATVTVNPAGASATLTVTATGRSGERVTSSPAGINVSVGSTGSSGFAVNTSMTLTVTNGRDAIWSGACSSGGNKTRTCTFTMTGNAAVTANVQ